MFMVQKMLDAVIWNKQDSKLSWWLIFFKMVFEELAIDSGIEVLKCLIFSRIGFSELAIDNIIACLNDRK